MQIARLKSGGAINRSFFKHQSARETVFRYQMGVLCNPESKYNVMWQWKTKFVISFSYVSQLLSLYVFVLVSLPVNPRMRRRLIWERRLIYFSVNDGISSPWRTSPLSGNVQANEVGGRDASAKKKSRTSSTWKHHIGSVHMKCYLNTVYQLRIRGRNEGVKWEGGLNNFHRSPDWDGRIKEGLIREFTVYIWYSQLFYFSIQTWPIRHREQRKSVV